MSRLPSTSELLAALRSIPQADYGDKHGEHLMEQYKLYLELTDRISSRRQGANSFFLAVNTALVTVAGFLAGLTTCSTIWPFAIGLAGLVLCYTWYRLIRSYRDLNRGKFLVVHAFEQMLPTRPYNAEWLALGEGKDPKQYKPFTHIEATVPWVFFVLYCILLVLCAVRMIWPGLL